MGDRPVASERRDRATVRVEQYLKYQREGFLLVPGLVAPEDVRRLLSYADDVLRGRLAVPGLDAPPFDATLDQLARRLPRFHMGHRVHAEAEWALLHPRVLDVAECLAGPDLLALQSTLILGPPGGHGGAGWHQDSQFLATLPDTLVAAWIALDPVDEETGCLWVAPSSHCEPVYPTIDAPPPSPALMRSRRGHGDLVEGYSTRAVDDSLNVLTPVAARYGPWKPCPMQPGDVLFHHSHLLHRSHPNRAADRFGRMYVSHYCNARSWTPWDYGQPSEGGGANHLHILARGATHLPHAAPRFGTPVELTPPQSAAAAARLAPMPSGEMGSTEA